MQRGDTPHTRQELSNSNRSLESQTLAAAGLKRPTSTVTMQMKAVYLLTTLALRAGGETTPIFDTSTASEPGSVKGLEFKQRLYSPRGLPLMSRGTAAAATWIVRGDESRPRRGRG